MRVRATYFLGTAALVAGILATPVMAQQDTTNNNRVVGRQRNQNQQQFGGFGMNGQRLTQLGATEAEKAVITALQTAKTAAGAAYSAKLGEGRALLQNDTTTPEQFTKAMAELEALKAKYQKDVAKLDADAKAKLSPKIQFAMFAAGILDNGLGMGGGGRRGGRQGGLGGPGGPGGPNGGGPGGPGGGPGGPPPAGAPPPPGQ